MIGLLGVLLYRVRRRPAWQYTTAAGVGILLAATLFSVTQKVAWFIALYWAVVTATTVGYGDVVPHNTAGRIVAMGTMLTVIPLLAAAFADWASFLATMHLRRWIGMHRINAQDHWVILGYTSLIPHLLPDLLARHPHVVLVAEDLDRGHLPEHPGMELLAGDPTNPHVLAKAELPRAKQVLIVGSTDGDVLMTAIEAQRLAPATPKLAVTERQNAVQALQDLGVDAIDTQSWLQRFILERLEADAQAASPESPPVR